MDYQLRLAENLARVQARIGAAARRSGRAPADVTLVAVTKYVSVDVARQLIKAGCHNLGESRPQELWAKVDTLRIPENTQRPQVIRWHLIGHLQRNKVQRTLPLVSMIHSADSVRLLETMEVAAHDAQLRIPVLIEVNISGDTTKHGFAPQELEPNLAKLAAFPSLDIRGLMTMASREGDVAQARREFAQLRQLRDRLRNLVPSNIKMDELSMGMSGDFEVAIEEGATIVRIGSALFEGSAAI